MATYITIIHFTAQGMEMIDDSTKRAAAMKSAGKKMGVKITDIFWTLGDFDGMLIFEAADEESAAAFLLHLGTGGSVTTSTVRAFNSAEFDKIVAKLQVG